jgi:hypothetical protein
VEHPPQLRVDFNELLEADLVLLSRDDAKIDTDGNLVTLHEGMLVSIFDEDFDQSGNPDNLIALGVVERNKNAGWAAHVKWCCRIDSAGINHQSDFSAH